MQSIPCAIYPKHACNQFRVRSTPNTHAINSVCDLPQTRMRSIPCAIYPKHTHLRMHACLLAQNHLTTFFFPKALRNWLFSASLSILSTPTSRRVPPVNFERELGMTPLMPRSHPHASNAAMSAFRMNVPQLCRLPFQRIKKLLNITASCEEIWMDRLGTLGKGNWSQLVDTAQHVRW